LGSLTGVIFGALLLEYLPIYSQDPPFGTFELSTQAPSVVFGAVLIVIMLLIPGGVAGLLRRIGALLQRALGGRRTPAEAVAVSPVETQE
jgi:branched-chain amino acid transport system permease protein